MTLFEVARDQTGPRIIQLTIFLPNRVGALLSVVRVFEQENIQLCALSILDAADHAVVRLVVDRPDTAEDALARTGHEAFRAELLGVEVPTGSDQGPKKILSALIAAEVNIHYMYAVMTRPNGKPAVALHVDDYSTAAKALTNHGLTLIGQDEIGW